MIETTNSGKPTRPVLPSMASLSSIAKHLPPRKEIPNFSLPSSETSESTVTYPQDVKSQQGKDSNRRMIECAISQLDLHHEDIEDLKNSFKLNTRYKESKDAAAAALMGLKVNKVEGRPHHSYQSPRSGSIGKRVLTHRTGASHQSYMPYIGAPFRVSPNQRSIRQPHHYPPTSGSHSQSADLQSRMYPSRLAVVPTGYLGHTFQHMPVIRQQPMQHIEEHSQILGKVRSTDFGWEIIIIAPGFDINNIRVLLMTTQKTSNKRPNIEPHKVESTSVNSHSTVNHTKLESNSNAQELRVLIKAYRCKIIQNIDGSVVKKSLSASTIIPLNVGPIHATVSIGRLNKEHFRIRITRSI
ncbi:hypothetical protein HDV02_003975 [Globomyces sp. JEL0801]|nr:hypothetical protein HDV02_003975 [Globomyces sp. JEL0801]